MKNLFTFLIALCVSMVADAQTFQWANLTPSSGASTNYDIVTDANGNTYAVGVFSGTTTFGSTNITSLGAGDAFVCKRSPAGAVLWTVRVGGTSADIAFAVALDTAGNAVVTGQFAGTATFGSTTFTSNGGTDIFVMKVSSAGSVLWASRFGGSGNENVNDICVNRSNLIYLVGYFSNTATFGSTTYLSNGGTDVFTLRLLANGSLLSSAQFGGTSSDYGNSIAVDTSSRVVITGYYAGSISFGSNTLTSAGGNDAFVVGTSATFAVSWANSYGSAGNEQGNGVAIDKALNIYVTGGFANTINVGSTTLVSAGNTDGFVMKLNLQGTPQWALKMGGSQADYGSNITVTANGDILCTGVFSNLVTFGSTQRISNGGFDVFIVKLNQNATYSWMSQAGGANDDFPYGITATESNVYTCGTIRGSATFGSFSLTTSTGGISDMEAYTAALGLCPTSYATINASACESYTLNSQTYTASGTYQQSLLNAQGCDSIITLNLTIGGAGDANLQWAKSFSGTGSEGRSLAVDASGNVITTGWFEGTTDFNPGSGVFNMTSVGTSDIFITKQNAGGNFVWAKQIGSTGLNKGISITTDAAGNIYVTGVFFGTADFNPGAGVFNLTSVGDADVFVLKLDASGNFVWAKQLGSNLIDAANAITLDASGNVFVGGGFQGTGDFDPGAGTATLTSAGNYDVFLAKLNAAGDLLWVKQAGAAGSDLLNSLSTDALGNVYATGHFANTVDFDPGAGTNSFTSNGNLDVFIWKLNSSGNFVWVKQIGSSQADYGSKLTAMQSGFIHITGQYTGLADFDPGAGVFNLNVVNAIGDFFILKLDTAGNFVWANKVGGSSEEYGNGIVVDGAGNVFLAGSFSSNVDFDSGAGVTMLTSAGSADIFVMKLNAQGTLAWAKGMGSTFMDRAYDLQIDNSNNLYITGQFWFTVDFDPGAGETFLTAASASEAYTAKFGACCVSSSATIAASVCEKYISPSGNYTWTSSGTYTDTIQNLSGCDSVLTIQLTIKPKTTSTINQSICQGQSFFFNGANRNVQGVYYDTLVNAAGCDSIITLNLTVNANPTASISPATVAICNGGSATLTASGGTTYSWSNSLGTGATKTVSPTSNTTYTVTVTDGNSCTATASRLVTVNNNPTASISPATVAICNGDNATLTASGGTTYSWSNSLGTGATKTVSPTSNITYTVTVTDGNNCTATASRLVTVNNNPTANISPATIVICNGDNATLTANGGTSYAWSNGLGTGATKTVSPTSNTTYTVTVTDGNNCTATSSKLVTVNSLPNAAINGPTTICSGLSATLTASGGTTYSWSNSLGTGATKTVSPTSNTTYTVTVTDGNSCTATASQTVSVTTAPTATITGVQTICAGEQTTLTANGGNTYQWANGLGTNASINVSPTTNTSYTVTVTVGANCTATTSAIVTVYQPASTLLNETICAGSGYLFNGITRTVAGTYKDTLQTIHGCDSVITLQLTVTPALTGSITQTICSGTAFNFNGQTLTQAGVYADTLQNTNGCDSIVTLTLTVSPAIQFAYSDGICAGDSYLFNGTSLTNAGVYNDTLSTATGCDSIVTLTLVINPLPQPTIQQTADTLSTQVFATYQWLRNDTAIANANTQQLVITQDGKYRVVVTDDFGCSDTSSAVNVTGVGVEDIRLDNTRFAIYPNPVFDVLNIESSEEIQAIQVADITGRIIIAENNLSTLTTQLPTSILAEATYFIHLKTTTGKTLTKSFVKQ